MRSLTPDFRLKKRFFRAFEAKSHTPERKKQFPDVCNTPFPKQGGPPEKKYDPESGLNQRDRATCGFAQDRSHGKPNKISTGGAFQLQTHAK